MRRNGVAMVAMILATLCAAEAAGAAQGKLVVGLGGMPSTLDPHAVTDFPVLVVLPNIFDTLLNRDPRTGAIRPHLAESYRVVSPTVWEFKLRAGVRFSNGEPVDAAAVKFSLERILDPKLKSRQVGYFRSVSSVEVADDSTVRIHTKVPDAVLDAMLAVFGWIVPPKYYGSHGLDYLSARPVGSGPYQLERWQRGEQIVMKANASYWIPGVPKIKTAVIKAIPEDATRVAALLSGDVDFIDNVPPQMVGQIQAGSDTEVISALAPRSAAVLMVTKRGPLADQRVRQALNYAVDVDSIIRNVLHGHGKRVPILQIPESFGYPADVKPYAHDPTRARQLLAEAGYPHGFEVNLYVPSGRFLLGEEVTEAISGQLEKVGVRAHVRALEWGAMRRVIESRYKPDVDPFLYFLARFDMILDADFIYEAFLRSDSAFGGFRDGGVDRLLDAGRRTVDRIKRAALYTDLTRELLEKAPMIFLYQEGAIFARRRNVVWTPRVDMRFFFFEADLRR